MNTRAVFSLAVVILVVVNTALWVLGQSDWSPCPSEGSGPGKPEYIACPAPSAYNCGLNGWAWTTRQVMLRDVVSTFGNHYTVEAAILPHAALTPVGNSFSADVLTRTSVICGVGINEYGEEVGGEDVDNIAIPGRWYTPYNGAFQSIPSLEENDYTTAGSGVWCYRYRDCNWQSSGTIRAWVPSYVTAGVLGEWLDYSEMGCPQKTCKQDEATYKQLGTTVIPCYYYPSEW